LATTLGPKAFKSVTGLAIGLLGIWSLVGVGLRAETGSPVQWASYTASAIEAAKAAGKPAIIDFGADWCTACKELDEDTFTDPRVVEQFKRFAAVRADMTHDQDPNVLALQRQYQVVGLPTVVFLGADGQERRELRLTGFVPPNDFLNRMEKAAGAGSAVAQR
jgi:thioredoxin:protein disulfide reductase